MEKRLTSLSLFEFQNQFPDENKCKEYLANLKWKNGFERSKCGHGRYCGGNGIYDRQCTSCRYIESPTAGTMFHKSKVLILKADAARHFTLSIIWRPPKTELVVPN